MIFRMCTIYDIKAEVYLPPMVFRSLGEAERVFSDICHDKNSGISKHPEDYKLFEMGTYNDEDCSIISLQVPRLLVHGSSLVSGASDSVTK